MFHSLVQLKPNPNPNPVPNHTIPNPTLKLTTIYTLNLGLHPKM